MKKNLLLRLCLMMVVVLSLFSCRQDFLPEKETYHNTSAFQLKSNRISLNESKHKAKLLSELEKAEAKFKEKSSALGKIVNYGDGISIDTEDVIYIENGPNYYTYTFKISRNNAPADAPLENLVLSPLSDGSWKEVLVTYNLTEQEKQTMLAGGAVELNGKVTKETLQSGTYSSGIMNKGLADECFMMTYSYYTSCSENAHHHGEAADEDGGPCEAETQSVLVVTQALVCPNPGGNITNPGGNESGTTPGGFNPSGGGATTHPNDPNGSNGSNNPNQPCDGNGIPSQPQDPSSTLGNQPCGNGTPTLPNLGGNLNMQEPCNQLKQVSENTNVKAKFTTLKNNINGTNEKGILIRNVAGNETSDIIEGDGEGNIIYPYNTNDPYYYQTYGTAHNHLKNNPEHIGIFTPEDLYQLVGNAMIEMNPANPNVSSTPKKSVIFVLTDKGFFALKITDVLKLADFIVWYDNLTEKKREDYILGTFQDKKEYNIRPTATHDQQVTGFLRFMKDKDIGVELYEGNKDTFGNWRKLELVDNGGNFSFNEIPCNL